MTPETDNTVPEVTLDPIDASYETWKLDPSQENLRTVVTHLQPTINYTLHSLGVMDDPVIAGEAQIVAANAVKKYDPSRGAGLKTHLSNQLKQMNRMVRTIRSPLKIPERRQFEHYGMLRSQQEFEDKHGRQPSTIELADYMGVPTTRIQELRSIPRMMSEKQFGAGTEDAEGDKLEPIVEEPSYLEDAIRYVYTSSSPLDQKIFEYMTGHLGSDMLPPAEIADKLNISQSQISRRFARMMSELQDIEKSLTEVYGG